MNNQDAREALRVATRTLDALGVLWWLDCGTLLGHVREGGILAHDLDVDLSSTDWKRAGEIHEAMVAAGFKPFRTFGTPEHGYEQRFTWRDVKLDIFYFYDEGETYWQGSWLDDHLIVSRFDKTIIGRTKKLKGFRVPSQPEALLEARYGDWRTPNTEWDWATDPLCITPESNPLLLETTFLVKTFLRHDLALRCVRSIKERYPSKVLVVDDSDAPKSFEDELKALGVKLLRLPYDSGLSAGRNAGIKQIATPYTVVLDDDTIVTQESRIDRMLRLLSRADIVCGAMRQDGELVDWHGSYLRRENGLILVPFDGEYEEANTVRFARVDFGLNFLAARTAFLRSNRWDVNLKTHEHTDFFLRLKDTKARVVFAPDSIFGHAPEKPNAYRSMRYRREFRLKFFAKHGLAYHVGLNGSRDNWSRRDAKALRTIEQGGSMSQLKLYEVTINGIRTTLRLSDEGARRRGLLPKEEEPKAQEPKTTKKRVAPNKKRQASNK